MEHSAERVEIVDKSMKSHTKETNLEHYYGTAEKVLETLKTSRFGTRNLFPVVPEFDFWLYHQMTQRNDIFNMSDSERYVEWLMSEYGTR